MPGGALAVHKPYRMALGYLLGGETFPDDGHASSVLAWRDPELVAPFLDRLDRREVDIVGVQVARGINAPVASSAGRLFDAASSLLGLRDVDEFEAQAVIDLEMAAERGPHRSLPYALQRVDGTLVYDPAPTLKALLEGMPAGDAPGRLAARFQETVAAVTRRAVRGRPSKDMTG